MTSSLAARRPQCQLDVRDAAVAHPALAKVAGPVVAPVLDHHAPWLLAGVHPWWQLLLGQEVLWLDVPVEDLVGLQGGVGQVVQVMSVH